MLRSKTLLYATVALLPFLSSTAAWAADGQDSSTGAAAVDNNSGKLSDIIVTAQRRGEKLQNVPVAETVLSQDALSKANATQFTDLAKLVPSLTLIQSATPLESTISIRGVGTYAFGVGIERSVAILIDDVPVAVQSQAFTNLSDVAQIEVLRGPQSTLFGKSADAGVITIATLKSSKELSGRIVALATTDDEQRVTGTISAPLTSNLGFRLSGEWNHYRGTLKNIANDSYLNGRKEYSIKGRLDWAPTESFSATLQGHFDHDNTTCCTWAPISIASTATFRGVAGLTSAVIYPGVTIDRSNNETRLDAPVIYDSRDKGGSVRLSYNLGGPTLLSISSYEDFYGNDQQDQDNTDFDTVAIATAGAQHGSVKSNGTTKFKQVTQEFRLVSPSQGTFRYVLGGFYSHNTNSRAYVRGPGFSLSNYIYHTGSDLYAVFGQTEWDFAPRLTLVTGLRYNNQNVFGSISNFLKNTAFPLPGTPDHSDDAAVTGKAALQFHPNQNVMLYASYSRGYKGEGYDLGNSTNAAIFAKQPVKAETSNAYEIGAKTSLLDNHLTFNIAGFWTDFTNFQDEEVEPVLGGAFVIANVGSLRTRGVEIDAQYRTGGLTIGAGGTYLDAKIRSFPQADCYTGQTVAQGCIANGIQDLSGKRLNNAPKWKGNIDADYTAPITHGWEGAIGAAFSYTSAVQYEVENDPTTIQRGYGIVNLRVGVHQAGSKGLSLTAFVNNLFDKHYYVSMSPDPYFTGPSLVGYLPRDFRRYAGFKASYSF